MNAEHSTQKLYHRACKTCRANHRFCDKTLPRCRQCTIRNQNCEWVVKESNKKVSFTDHSKQYASPPPSSYEQNINRVYSVHQHTKQCEEDMRGQIPVISPKRLGKLLKYVRDISTNKKPSFIPPQSELALVLAMEALSFSRSGSKEIAFKLHRKSIDVLGEQPLSVNFEVAATKAYLGLYLLDRGHSDAGKSLLLETKSFCDCSKHQYKMFLSQCVESNLALLQEAYLPKYVIAQLNAILPEPVSSTHNWTPDSVSQAEQILLKSYEDVYSQYNAPPEVAAKKMTLQMMILGGRLQCMKRGHKVVMTPLEIADRITALTKSEYFVSTPFWTAVGVVEACFILKYHIEQTGDRTLVDSLRQNVATLIRMTQRYEALYIYRNTIMELQTFVENYDTINDMNLKLMMVSSFA